MPESSNWIRLLKFPHPPSLQHQASFLVLPGIFFLLPLWQSLMIFTLYLRLNLYFYLVIRPPVIHFLLSQECSVIFFYSNLKHLFAYDSSMCKFQIDCKIIYYIIIPGLFTLCISIFLRKLHIKNLIWFKFVS